MNTDLETLYSPSAWSVRLSRSEVIQHFDVVKNKQSKDALHSYPHVRVEYGNGPEQCFYIFGDDLPPGSPVLVFIHGGYWQAGTADEYCGSVPPFVKSGIVTVIFGYALAPSVNMTTIVHQTISGISKLEDIIENKKLGDVWLSGHSAGAHLALIASQKCTSTFVGRITGLLLYSGVYDLFEPSQTSLNDALKLTRNEIEEFSPARHVKELKSRIRDDMLILIVLAEHDSPAFKQQAKLYQQKLEESNQRSSLLTVGGTDHFSLILELPNKDYELTKVVIRYITSPGTVKHGMKTARQDN